MEKEKRCKNCVFWQDYERRVWAKLSSPCDASTRSRGIVELRSCEWVPHPSVDAPNIGVYTDEEFCCVEWKKREK